MSDDPYVFTHCAGASGAPDLGVLRCGVVADARARFGAAGGHDALLGASPDTAAARGPFDALAIGCDWDRIPALDDPLVARWARWLIERLDGAQAIYKRSGEGWRLHSGKLHGENERRLGELSGWSDTALADQRKLLEHVEDPGDSGSELEQSLSKLAAAGWNVDAKKDKGPPKTHFAVGDLPLALGDDWRSDGAVHPRLAAALVFFLTALPVDERAGADPGQATLPAKRLPATAVAGADAGVALLDIRTVAKALRDAGALELPNGEPIGTLLTPAPFRLTPLTARNGGDPADGADPNDPTILIAVHGADAVRVALLHAAAPAKRFRGGDDVVGYAAAFLASARELAAERLDGSAPPSERIDNDDGLRRRLAGWCDTAVARSAENHQRLEPHRATRNAIALLARIRDFDARVAAQRGELTGADRDALAIALSVLAQLLAPLAPTTAGELWSRCGRPGTPADAAWPSPQRQPAAA